MPENTPTFTVDVQHGHRGDQSHHTEVANWSIDENRLHVSMADGGAAIYAAGEWQTFHAYSGERRVEDVPGCPMDHGPTGIACALTAGHVGDHTTSLGERWADQ